MYVTEGDNTQTDQHVGTAIRLTWWMNTDALSSFQCCVSWDAGLTKETVAATLQLDFWVSLQCWNCNSRPYIRVSTHHGKIFETLPSPAPRNHKSGLRLRAQIQTSDNKSLCN